jgi:CheY-like chemotaxis protein
VVVVVVVVVVKRSWSSKTRMRCAKSPAASWPATGYQVLTAHNGLEALNIAEHAAGSIHLLLTDVIMPQMLGKELATRVCELYPATRVLYMSGYAQPVLATQGTLDPDVTLVEKPFSEAALLGHVRTVLDTRLRPC